MKIITILFLLLTSLVAKVEYTHIFDAYENAKKNDKLVLVMLSQKGCPGCEHMKDIVFEEKSVNSYMQKHFEIVHVDVYEEGAPDGLDFFGTPTFYILDADENILKRVNGGQNPQDFLKTLKSVEK